MYRICKIVSNYCSKYKRVYCACRRYSSAGHNIETGKKCDDAFANIYKYTNNAKRDATAVTYSDSDFNTGRKILHNIQNIAIRCVYFFLCMFALVLCVYGAIGYLYVVYDFFNCR